MCHQLLVLSTKNTGFEIFRLFLTVIISSKVAQYLSLISDYSAYQTMPESGCAATVYLCQHELGVGQINVCREAFLKKCAGEEKCPIQPQHYYPP